MYMGVIPSAVIKCRKSDGAPHVYGGDPYLPASTANDSEVLPMYMGVILVLFQERSCYYCAPHVYGGDPLVDVSV